MESAVRVKEIYRVVDIPNVQQQDSYTLWKNAVARQDAMPTPPSLPKRFLDRYEDSMLISALIPEQHTVALRFAPPPLRTVQAELRHGHSLMLGRETPDRHKEMLTVMEVFKKPLLLTFTVSDTAGQAIAVTALVLPLAEDGQRPTMMVHHLQVVKTGNRFTQAGHAA